MTATRSTTKPDLRAPRVITARVTDEQYNHLLVQAHLHGLRLSETIRLVIGRDLEAQPDLGHEDGSPGSSMSYRGLLATADLSAVAEELRGEGDASS